MFHYRYRLIGTCKVDKDYNYKKIYYKRTKVTFPNIFQEVTGEV